MYGDYSRGHEPDRKRGRNYRRVLLQMGRPVLDSDVASLVDATLGELRASVRGLGSAAGSADHGFLVTPGRLLAIFAEADGLTTTSGTPDAWIDYRHRFLDRYPALYLHGRGGAAQVSIPLLQPFDPGVGGGRAALWARVETATTLQVGGIAVNLAPGTPDVAQRVELSLPAASLARVDIGLPAGAEAWLFLLEQDEAAGDQPAFWVAPGTYQVDGLVVDARGGGAFPDVAFPESDGFPWRGSPEPEPPLGGLLPDDLDPGDRLVAYLEAWERHVTAVEDPGIREEALGATDTCARTELLGQVKLATVTGTPSEAELRAAFGSVVASGGPLTIDVAATEETTDPCELPQLGGYTGSENRLYRIEVHEGGGLAQARFKWSRDNGADLFAARVDDDGNLVFDPGTPLAGGDLVEVLSHVVDLGDETIASVGTGGLVPPLRAVGQLARLAAVGVSSSADELVFRLADPNNDALDVTLDDRYGTLSASVLKLRRWHGLLDPDGAAGPHVLEEGIAVDLSGPGTYRPGQWWQYEARVRRDNANGPWREAPHGPERRFAPLALLEYEGAGQPLRLVAWLDERYSHSGALDADGVAFAGGRVGSVSETVQEAIEELFEREIHESSCTVTVTPGDDLAARLTELPADGGELCFEAGTYDLAEPLVFRGRSRVVVHGAGPATLIRARSSEAALVFEDCTEIAVRSLRVIGAYASGAATEHLNGAISFVGGGDVSVSDCDLICPDAQADRSGQLRSGQTCITARGGARPLRARVEGNRLDVGTRQTGVLLVDPAHAFVAENSIRVAGARDLPTGRVADGGIVVGGRAVGTVEILDNLVEQTVQGIHVAASGPDADREAADAVLLSRNVVHARVPAAHRRGRHAVFVGNARTVHVKDTIATLERTGGGAQTDVDAVRLHGAFGPFLAVRQTSARAFTTGVRVEPLEPLPSPRMWLVAETMADGATLGADAPESVEQERNYPERRPVATLTLVPEHATRPAGTEHTIRAEARDAAGAPVVGVLIRWRVLGPANTQTEETVPTDAQGRADLTYTGTDAGHDTVSAYADTDENGRQDPDEPVTLATVVFTGAAATVELAQNATTSLRGSTTVVTATVETGSGQPVFDARVVFSVSGANPKPAQGVRTNAAGQAVFNYTGGNAGTDTIRAFVDANENNTRDTGEPEGTATHVYEAPVPTGITLLPPSGVAPIGSTPLFSATVRDASNQPLPGALVRFVVTGANARAGSSTTNADGVATFQYTGTNPGTDSIVAFADINNNTTREANEPQAQAVRTFTELGPVLVTVPSTIGMTEANAAAALAAAQVALGSVTRRPDPPRPSPRAIIRGPFVISQAPAPNALVPRGSRVNIVVQREWIELLERFERDLRIDER